MKTMRSELVQQIVSCREVGSELRDRIDSINDCGYSIKNVIETTVNNVYNKQGFIIVYECDVSDAYENAPSENKSELNKMIFYFGNRDQTIEFIDKLRTIIRCANHVTVNQAFHVCSTIVGKPIRFDETDDTHLIGWTDLSCLIDEDGSYDSSIMETFIPNHFCTLTLPAPEYLTEA